MSTKTITLEQIVARTTDLPSIPAAALRIIREAESADASAASIANHLATDQALSVRVLRLANSSYYGLERQITDLNEAVVILGMRVVKNLAMVASTYPWMTRPLAGYCLGPEEMWKHAFATAVGAQEVASLSRKVSPESAFTAGLLHDVGKVALSVWLESKVTAILHYATREKIGFDDAERKILGFDHTHVGEHLAKSWNLPEEICLCARYHHHPSDCPTGSAMVDCVHVGNYLVLCMGFGLGGDGLQYAFDAAALGRLGLSISQLDQVTDSFVTQYEKFETIFQGLAA
jgi:putative nucleotidyltransferase with HDIG domain